MPRKHQERTCFCDRNIHPTWNLHTGEIRSLQDKRRLERIIEDGQPSQAHPPAENANKLGTTRDEVNARTIPGFWTSQRPQSAGDPGTRPYRRLSGVRATPAKAALVAKVLDDEPTMAGDWSQYWSIRSLFTPYLGPEVAYSPIVLGIILWLFVFKMEDMHCANSIYDGKSEERRVKERFKSRGNGRY